MGRPDITDWVDFIRETAGLDTEQRMKEALEAGDTAAERTVEQLSRVQDVLRADAEIHIPDYALRMAKAISSVRRPREEVPRSSLWRFLPFEISYDSGSVSALTGVRDLESSFRQISFKAEGYKVDLRMENDTDPRQTLVVGQVLNVERDPLPVAEVPVLAVAAGEIVDRSITSRFGEFQAEGLPKETLDLYVLLSEESCLRLPIDQESVG